MKWFFFLSLAVNAYQFCSPRVEIRIEEVVKTHAPACPLPRDCEPCTLTIKPPDQVFVVSQDEPCRCYEE
jgi:hypothetical protein